ncbi:PTS glucose transporter subunit IIA [Enterococcus hulanensis]|uniref:PTS glucose transporter subunit IIA n=1 Tax=Enterococcus hulanensis TaxID=2559929 RepID=A0ABU3EZ74_9ENTE|nr:PTS glucose transporter subunit IIA [Enterococcus hulanensis]MDT2600150.1 PTS glucose transporter subunit IIA [Enterococcus hulanensis]MDT2608963.1 PTS glucose transporter subunit IIA [Enterococcus hulanensis]MDT2616995.1 PTS glucose transporter subunit IIA [Enterococcus hulanensis]MDT2628485.1 PTS glucose transporter subunit IIA [Enterococcus hulanensis]MDT2655825.1 PTS glucose transporter subunit IIA [Enterococcus hulanensis]
MFNKLFKKKTTVVYSPVSGKVIQLSEVDDDVFSSEMMGIGFAVQPESNTLVSPIDGVIESVFPTKHALMIKGDKGIEVLVHIGVDTVELNGKGFEILVEPGEKVAAQQKIANIDFDTIKVAGKGIEVMVIFPNLDKIKKEVFNLSNEGEIIAEL